MTAREAGLADAGDIADVLADAFAGDPVMTWMFGVRAPYRTFFLEMARGVYLRRGFGHVDSDGAAAALWLPPGASRTLPFTNEARIALALLVRGGVRSVSRALHAGDVVGDYHPPTPHYYLFAVGVRPGFQGQGCGGAILRAGLARIDAEGAPAYLENSKPRNTPLYQRMGFEAQQAFRFAPDAPPLVPMLRPAGGGA